MNLLDLLIGLPILFACFRGFTNGVIKEVLSIVALVLGVFLTFRYMDAVAALIAPLLNGYENYAPFIAGAAVFLGTLVIVQLIAYGATQFLVAVKLNPFNRIAGAGFGIIKSAVIISTILLILAGFGLPSQETRQDSLLYGWVIHAAPWAYNAVASIYPGAEYFSDTIDRTLGEYQPSNNFPAF